MATLPKGGGQGGVTPNPQFGSSDPAEGTRGQPTGRPRAHRVTRQTPGTRAPQNTPLPGLEGPAPPDPKHTQPPKETSQAPCKAKSAPQTSLGTTAHPQQHGVGVTHG